MNHRIYPKIELNVNENIDSIELLKGLELLIKDLMMIISFLIFHRVSPFGYLAKFFDNKGNLTEEITYKSSEIECGDEYIIDDHTSKFTKYFTGENISLLLNSFSNKTINEQKELKKLIFGFVSLSEKITFEYLFLKSFIVLESFCKFIKLKNKIDIPKSNKGYTQSLIEIVLGENGLETEIEKFKRSNDGIWIITTYRNDLVHFNNVEFDNELIIQEYQKLMLLNRRLILRYIASNLELFPYPKYKYE